MTGNCASAGMMIRIIRILRFRCRVVVRGQKCSPAAVTIRQGMRGRGLDASHTKIPSPYRSCNPKLDPYLPLFPCVQEEIIFARARKRAKLRLKAKEVEMDLRTTPTKPEDGPNSSRLDLRTVIKPTLTIIHVTIINASVVDESVTMRIFRKDVRNHCYRSDVRSQCSFAPSSKVCGSIAPKSIASRCVEEYSR